MGLGQPTIYRLQSSRKSITRRNVLLLYVTLLLFYQAVKNAIANRLVKSKTVIGVSNIEETAVELTEVELLLVEYMPINSLALYPNIASWESYANQDRN